MISLLTVHHLIPRCRWKRYIKRKGDRAKLAKKTALICQPCHTEIHKLVSETDMARTYNTLQKLKTHRKIRKYLTWKRRRT